MNFCGVTPRDSGSETYPRPVFPPLAPFHVVKLADRLFTIDPSRL